MTVDDYLRENGPARDPVELVSRLDAFNWRELRQGLIARDIYFGRFLGKRLVFIHHEDLEMLVLITRDPQHTLSEYARLVLTILSERSGYTQSELSRLTKLSSSQVGDALRELEDQLYISRTGFELTLTHGGFPNPRYITLPDVEYTKEKYEQAVSSVIESCCHWYGPLTLNDLLRITRLTYTVLEKALETVDLISKIVMGVIHYGHEYSFQSLEQLNIQHHELDEVFLLSPLDPYFYMTSGSFRRDFLPRQTRLTIIHQGLPRGYVELAIPDKDILQVVNLQINQRDLNNFKFIQDVGYQLRRLGRVAYETPVIYIEEIRYQPANHTDNQIVVTTLAEIDFHLQFDVLVSGTGLNHTFSMEDIYATRQIHKKLEQERQYNDLEALLNDHPVVSEQDILSMLNIDYQNLRLLLSHYLRKRRLHYYKGELYSNDLFTTLVSSRIIDDKLFDLEVYQTLTKPMSRSEIDQELDLPPDQILEQLNQLLSAYAIEVVSPFSKVREYRRINHQKVSLRKKLDTIVWHIIKSSGPVSFGDLLHKTNESITDTDINRSQILLTLSSLFDKQRISSAAIGMDQKFREVMYFTPEQAKILGDPDKRRFFDRWQVYTKEDEIFPVQNKDTHVLTFHGKQAASFQFKRDGDTGIIENLTLQIYDLVVDEMVEYLEKFVFDQGLIRVQLNKLGGAIPEYWIDLASDQE